MFDRDKDEAAAEAGVKFLKENGYREFDVCSQDKDILRHFGKRFEVGDPEGHRIELIVALWQLGHRHSGGLPGAFEVDACFETSDETWLKIQRYSIAPSKLVERLPEYEQKMFAALKLFDGVLRK